MSYILEALKKSQRERHLGKVPTIETSQLESLTKQAEPARWTYAAIVLAVAAIIIAAYSVLDSRTEMPVSAGYDLASARLAASNTIDASKRIADPDPARVRQVAGSEPRSPAAPDTPSQPLALATTGLAPEPAGFDDQAALEQLAPSTTGVQRTRPEALNITVSALETTDEPPQKVGTAVALLSQLPLEFQQTVPPMSLDVHVFRETPERRFVLINETLYREGEHTAEGAVVEEIVPDGVILEYGGELFRIGT